MRQQPERVVHAAAERVPPVLSNRGFRLLWLAQIIGQTAQTARPALVMISSLRLLQRSTRMPEKTPKATVGTTKASTTTLVLVVDLVSSRTTTISA